MIDSVTHERVEVYQEGAGGPYLMVPEDQVEAVTLALKVAGINYWTDENSISLDDEPFISIVNFERDADVALIQKILDSI